MSAAGGLPHSVQVRLVRHAKAIGADPNLVLTRYAVERFLYRLSRSRHVERFILKGALLMLVWLDDAVRPTRDADVLGFGDLSDESLTGVFREVCAVEVEPDGMTYLVDSCRIVAIRPEEVYGGKRVTLDARLGTIPLRVQVDVGIGDAVVPPAEWLDYPTLLDLPRPRLRMYQPETAIAENVHTMVQLGTVNSRMRDYFDIHVLAQRRSFDGHRLARAFRATFLRRNTAIPEELPVGLTPEFAALRGKQAQWAGFLKKNGVSGSAGDLAQVIDRLGEFLAPVLKAAREGSDRWTSTWPPGTGTGRVWGRIFRCERRRS